MKHIIVALVSALLLLATLPAQARVINRDEANEYFANCMSKKSDAVKVETLTTLCACTSARLMQSLTAEELHALSGKDAVAQAATHKMLTEVYAPCSETIAVDLINFECVNNEQLSDMNPDFDVPMVCGCSARSAAAWYQGKGKALMAEILKANPNVTDPVPALLAHPQMKNQILSNLVACSATPPTPPATPAPAVK